MFKCPNLGLSSARLLAGLAYMGLTNASALGFPVPASTSSPDRLRRNRSTTNTTIIPDTRMDIKTMPVIIPGEFAKLFPEPEVVRQKDPFPEYPVLH